MSFKRGSWLCAVKDCGGQGEYSVIVHVRTSGGRKDRIQKASDALRVCPACIKDVKRGKVPEELMAAFHQAIKRVKGER